MSRISVYTEGQLRYYDMRTAAFDQYRMADRLDGPMSASDWNKLRDWRDAWLHELYLQWQDAERDPQLPRR